MENTKAFSGSSCWHRASLYCTITSILSSLTLNVLGDRLSVICSPDINGSFCKNTLVYLAVNLVISLLAKFCLSLLFKYLGVAIAFCCLS